jgi:hypothetical protein
MIVGILSEIFGFVWHGSPRYFSIAVGITSSHHGWKIHPAW